MSASRVLPSGVAGWDEVGVARGRAAVVGLVGARGGAGTSTLAALTAARLTRRTSTVLVDLDPAGGGLDVTLGLEGADGARWPELAGARGDVPGQDVLALLPRWGACAVLSADRGGGAPEPALVADVLHALAGVVGAMVLDLPRGGVLTGAAVDEVPGTGGPLPGQPGAAGVLGGCDLVAVVARRDLRSVAGALAIRPRLAASGAGAGLIVLGRSAGGMSVSEVAAAVDLPVLWSGAAPRALAQAAERGVLPRRGPAVRAARAVAAQVAATRFVEQRATTAW